MKTFKAILCVGAVAALVACGGSEPTTTEPTPDAKVEQKEEPKKEEPKGAENPWMNLNVGDWVSYSSTMNAAGTTMTSDMKWTVTAKTDASVTYDMATTMMGNTTTTSITMNFADWKDPGMAAADAPMPETTDEDVMVGDKTVKCKKYTMKMADGSMTETWFSMDVPFGSVKTIAKDAAGTETMHMELTGWGSAQ